MLDIILVVDKRNSRVKYFYFRIFLFTSYFIFLPFFSIFIIFFLKGCIDLRDTRFLGRIHRDLFVP